MAGDGTKARVNVLEVRLGDTVVGSLTRLVDDTNLFAFDPTYAEDPSRPTLSLGFKGTAGTLVEHQRPTRVRLHPFFSNLLPEGHLRQYLSEKGGVNPNREFFLLRLLGTDLPGALTVLSLDDDAPRSEEAEHPSDGPASRPLRFSLAGLQLKFSALMEASGGLTLPIDGIGGNWIAKLPSTRYPGVPENEYAMTTLAGAVGIEIPEVRLMPTADIGNLPADLPESFGHSFITRRFDREDSGGRVHSEDFAQVFNVYPEDKYGAASFGNIAHVLWLETGEAGITQFVRRLAFNVLVGNGDAHIKNWSLMYPDGRAPRLAPAYDLVSTVAYIENDGLGLSLAGTKDFTEVDSGRFRRLAERAGLPVRLVVKTAADLAHAVRDIWPTHEPLRLLPPAIRQAVESHMQRVKL